MGAQRQQAGYNPSRPSGTGNRAPGQPTAARGQSDHDFMHAWQQEQWRKDEEERRRKEDQARQEEQRRQRQQSNAYGSRPQQQQQQQPRQGTQRPSSSASALQVRSSEEALQLLGL